MNSFRSLKLLGVIILLALCVLIICRYWSVNDTQKPFSRIATNQAGAAPNLGFSGSGASPARAATATSSGKAKGKSSYASGTVGLTKLLARGVKIDSRELPADTTGRWIRETLYQTDFKYPLIRVDETLKSNTDGNPIVVNRVAM